MLLTDEEIKNLFDNPDLTWRNFARAIESAVLDKLKAQEAEKRLLNFSCQLCLDTGFLPKAAILPEPPDIKCPNGCRPNNRHLQPDALKAQDKGPWKSGKNELDNRVFVQSDDFTHDVRLYIDGDFGGYEERLAYADGIADALNHPLPPDDLVRDTLKQQRDELALLVADFLSKPDVSVVLRQRDELLAALERLLESKEREAKAAFAFNNATENYGDDSKYESAYVDAALAASNAEAHARAAIASAKGEMKWSLKLL